MTSRRSFLASAAAAIPLVSAAGKKIPVGLELYSVRDQLQKDLMGTVQAVGKMGYQVVEFYSPYYEWTPDYAKQVRKVLDDSGLKCMSTHNGPKALSSDGIQKAIELNQIIGSKMIVLASAGKITSADGWRGVADTLTAADGKLKPLGMGTGYHNHELEFTKIDGKLPMEIIAANTPKSVTLQLDVGTCCEMGVDPVGWINSNPGRIRSMHCKDWKPGEGYRVLFGEGDTPWKKIFSAAESKGGIEFYLIEQEGSRMPSMETAKACLDNFRKIRGA
jgi:sugar phosphate isomerase/epimerase